MKGFILAFSSVSGSLLQKPIHNLRFRFRLAEPQRHQLDNLVSRYFADGRLVDQGCIRVVGCDLRNRADVGMVHDDGVTFGMAGAS